MPLWMAASTPSGDVPTTWVMAYVWSSGMRANVPAPDASQARLAGVARLLIVHHTPSPATHTLLEAVRDGATNADIRGVEVVLRPALTASSVETLEADGYVL